MPLALVVEDQILIAGGILALAVVAAVATRRLQLPLLVTFLGLGMLLGSEGIGGIYFDDAQLARSIGVVGLLLLSDDRRAPHRLHYLYGSLALAAVLSPWLYAPREPRRRLAWFAGATLVAAALAVRAYMTS